MDQTIESVLELHEQAFKKLDGIPETITYDNMTTVGKHVGPGEIWINPKFKAFAKKYGFKVIILPPGKKDRHGLVERPFHYIENNCLKGREFLDFEHLRSHGQLWLDNKANVRVHGSLRERPVDRLEKERHFLEKHPDNKFEMYKEINNRLIHRDFCVIVDTNRYSVHPDLVGKKANIRIYKERLEIWVDNKQEAIHVLLEGKYGKAVLVEHDAAYRGTNYQSVLLKKAILRLGEPAESYFTGLKRERGKAAGYHLQRILKMADRYGSDVVSGAISHAMRHGVYNADAIERIISGKNIKKRRINP
ncbi:MAG: IstA3 [Candidatus Magnetoglobus multicellularis str. Araruama]|uniref:IstA3 n=1 Tax=Candidatus Magnetoglobus multicellularis str. Araruama TaxID=890399 RepID=A0A1V1NT24_9BACT|nr:MAG: IstA3 [Candidatus Magnetoglobus multicellularis str. Araruama]